MLDQLLGNGTVSYPPRFGADPRLGRFIIENQKSYAIDVLCFERHFHDCAKRMNRRSIENADSRKPNFLGIFPKCLSCPIARNSLSVKDSFYFKPGR